MTFPISAFSIIMATGIISIAAKQGSQTTLATILFLLNNIFYLTCLILTIVKLANNYRTTITETVHYERGPSYLTFIAATNIIGVQYIEFTTATLYPIILFFIGSAFYFILTIALFIGMTIAKRKPNLTQGLDGTWLLYTVSGCSVVILGCSIEPYFHFSMISIMVLIGIWVTSLMLYFVMITLIFFRYFFRPLKEKDFSPTWWINMGALAISALSGCHLINIIQQTPFNFLHHFILTIIFCLWLLALWWGILLSVFFIFRVIDRSIRFQYSIKNWSAIFPIGMCYVSSFSVLTQLQLSSWLSMIQNLSIVTTILWAITFIQLLFFLFKKINSLSATKA